jgi:hypothetical protein
LQDWFENLVKDIIWKALCDAYADLTSKAENEIEEYLNSLTSGKQLSPNPLVKVLEVDNPPNSITFLIRGRIKLFKGVESAFMRIEVVMSKDVDLISGAFPVEIIEWRTVVGDIKLSKKKVFESNIALGYDKGIWLGRGTLKILPAGFGLDVFVGGINERGAMIGLDVDLPTPIPLGGTGLALAGLGGDFAYNFVPRLESGGVPVSEPTAKDYVTWARNSEVDRWVPGPIDQTAVGVGIRSDLRTMLDNGYCLTLEPIGLAVLTPGPIFILGGTGKLVKLNSIKAEGYLVVDIPSESLALGLGVTVKVPESGALVDAHGKLDAFFSFKDPDQWYINLGSDKSPVHAKVLKGMFHGEVYFMINNDQLRFGAGISIGDSWSWWVITLVARVGARVMALIGWNPLELEGGFSIFGELGIKIWWFKFLLAGQAEVIGYTPSPTQLDFKLRYKLSLPWPIPDVEGEKSVSYSDTSPQPPPLDSPFQVGESDVW